MNASRRRAATVLLAIVAVLVGESLFAVDGPPLSGTQPLVTGGDLSAQMVAGIDRALDRLTTGAVERRTEHWSVLRSDSETRTKFLAAKRAALRSILGATDERLSGAFEIITTPDAAPLSVSKPALTIERVRWPVFADVEGEGLLLRPPGPIRAAVIAIPDADAAAFDLIDFPIAQRLARAGCTVLVPVVANRSDRWSGSERLNRFTNQPHREWIHRQAFEMGRTLIGYEVQKMQAALDALRALAPEARLGVFGYGEGGLLAIYTAALDGRVAATVVSGYFGPREALWQEPIYRNLFGLLREFGDAEIAALIAPRKLLVEACAGPAVDGPPRPGERRAGAAPGRLVTPPSDAVRAEVKRANLLLGGMPIVAFFPKAEARTGDEACDVFVADLGLSQPTSAAPLEIHANFATPVDIQRRTVRKLEAHTQRLLRESESVRGGALWSRLKPGADFTAVQNQMRATLWEDVIGKLPTDYLPPNPRTRPLPPNPKWTGYEVTLDVLPEVFAWGWLLLPKDLKPGERRPVIVCQHGLEGLPEDVVTEDQSQRAWNFYKGFATQLAARGFIVYAPHNPYRGKDAFRLLQRKANPLGLSLFSFIIAQHDVTTRWLATLPFADAERIAFYGLSYGGKTAMRVPALLDRYCLSICSGDFNEWIGKVVSTEWQSNYPFTPEWEMPEWNLGHVAGYAEMAMLIAPRPFMVERGHDDGVGLDHWVGYEWAKVRRGYAKLGSSDRAEIEWFDGPHTIHGEGTFRFLHRHLGWPER